MPKHSTTAEILAKLKRFDDALASYDRALTLQPTYAEALYNRGNTLRELKRLNDALESYDRAISVRPDDANALSNRGVTLHDLKRFDEALASFERALALRPDDSEVLCNLGNTFTELRKFDKALAAYNGVLVKNTGHASALGGAAFSAINLCEWGRRAELSPIITTLVTTKKSIMSPFVLLGYSEEPALQLQCAKNYIGNKNSINSQAAVEWSDVAAREIASSVPLGRFPTARHGVSDGRAVRAARSISIRDRRYLVRDR